VNHSLDLAFKMVSPMFFGLFMGLYLDKIFRTPPLFMLGLTLLGVATGFWSIIKQAYSINPEPTEKPEKKATPNSDSET
jgi:F0F1-type ATP synthase assembly protein I